MKSKSGFKAGSGCFKCGNCGRLCRTIDDNYDSCIECWDIAGIENTISDGNYDSPFELENLKSVIRSLETRCREKGGVFTPVKF
jgi:hypothetical protein